ncbi:ABC transporter permease subunit [Arcanobacterium haemolyticum]|uniref:Maltose/maltodextrin transport system permease protein n=1 Tax=Arcanobacterium haemolyticum (strain ATCC 9345 / DSM 20595 / CCM 5947 / CCUG 17215 / LMG 16163 / NBRC 15585 / NCTC 8452 / 11018) TaxID=644284 RepID=D7BMI6_ARCHD|nr:ABC transporter permease subunit [Arcanobacterium haemolyticum]ADH92135.1 binding-protein-dependent transport systems inner membrane component [Arcanobacterium haemolyticum DSM 20595]QCX46297.1 ABC transporter permease subunit [Arcanobacterium haemolyticum]SQH29160.1 Maltose transport system permease protein malF [Arcanobacterium haemolyticum]
MSQMIKPTEASKKRAARRAERSKLDSPATTWGTGFIVKLVLMGIVNALGIFIIFTAFGVGSNILGSLMAVLLVALDWVYFSRRTLALKYLAPGLVFLLVFQAFVIFYTAYIAFTNYGHQHTLDKSTAIESILLQNSTKRVENSPQYPLVVVEKDGELGFAVVDPDKNVLKAGTESHKLTEVDGTFSGTQISEVSGYTIVPLSELGNRQDEVTKLRVPISDNPEDGAIGTQTGTVGYQFTSSITYDADADTMTDVETGTVYHADDDAGFFKADDGSTLNVGWRVVVGFDNFLKGFGDSRYAQPFFQVLVWNVIFAFMSVLTTFLLGMLLAIVLNDERLKGRKLYRTLLLLPYAFPSFMTAFLFAGLMNRSYGFFNQLLGTEIPWLTDPTMAKVSVILVNLWMGFPYMFLIVTGALQAIPGELTEAAKIDGATSFQVWRNVTLPQLMISLTPLLIASFAFNFNNFNLIYMLNGGGPRMGDASVPVGHTDILISMVYKIAGLTGEAAPNYGLAAAMSLVIFLIVGAVSLYSFKKSKSMEAL